VDVLKEPKNENKHVRVQLHPMPTPPPICGGHRILHVGLDCGRDEACQISSELVHGFWNRMGRKWPSSIDLASWHIALTGVYAL